VAVIGWVPGGRVFSERLALDPESWTVSRTVSPSRKVTVPAGVPAPGAIALTLALRVAAEP
jgi:hypothetical protein